MTPSSTTLTPGPRSYHTTRTHEFELAGEIAMTPADLVPAFDIATALWSAQAAMGDAAPDVVPGGLLDAASELQVVVGRMLAFAQARNESDIAVKESIAAKLDATQMLDEHDMPVGAALRASILADRLRLRHH